MENKTAFITGASRGIGLATTIKFFNQGWNVIATMRNPTIKSNLLDDKRVLLAEVDVLNNESIEQALKLGNQKFGSIDVVVNNAGFGSSGPLEATSVENIEKQYQVNVIGTLLVVRAALPYFRKQGRGTVCNISSMGGIVCFPFGALYNGSKFAIEGISEALQYELREIGCRIKIIEPGATSTDFATSSFVLNNDETLREYQELVHKLLSFFESKGKESQSPELVAETIFKAATDDQDQLRYVVGSDAEFLIAQRNKLNDLDFREFLLSAFESTTK